MEKEDKSFDVLHIIGMLDDLKRQIELKQIQSDSIGYDAGKDHPLAKGSGDREDEFPIKFKKPFLECPTVIVGISYIDANTSSQNLKFVSRANEVSQEGFKLVVKTFDSTIIYGYKISWIAYAQ